MSSRALVVARAEFAQAVRSRAFLISLMLAPILMIASIVIQRAVANRVDTRARTFAIIDASGVVSAPLVAAAETRNAILIPEGGEPKGPRFTPVVVAPTQDAVDTVRLAMSERVRKGDLFAFVEIPKDILTPGSLSPPSLRYSSDEPTYSDLPQWIGFAVGEIVRERRLRDAGMDPDAIAKLTQDVPTEQLGLYTQGPSGKIEEAPRVDPIRTFVVPVVLMFIVFMIVMTAAPQLLNSVLEEKLSRISEVLLGSVTPFQLMLGKLIGSAGIALLLGSIYVGGGLAVASYLGYGGILPFGMFPLLLTFLLLAVFFYGALYIAIGSACSELKDAQSLMTPVITLTFIPILLYSAVLKEPNGTLATVSSLAPPATPFLMLLRLALQPGPPAWQVALSIALTLGATIACVWAAGRIFRIGVLLHGKPASFREMLRWVTGRS